MMNVIAVDKSGAIARIPYMPVHHMYTFLTKSNSWALNSSSAMNICVRNRLTNLRFKSFFPCVELHDANSVGKLVYRFNAGITRLLRCLEEGVNLAMLS